MSNYYHTKTVKPLLEKLRKMPPTESGKQALPLRKEQFGLRLQRATGQAIKPDQFGKVRKNIARVKTLQRAQQIGQKAGDKA